MQTIFSKHKPDCGGTGFPSLMQTIFSADLGAIAGGFCVLSTIKGVVQQFELGGEIKLI
jgi:hypothetical protein